jgi:hypothetical protein
MAKGGKMTERASRSEVQRAVGTLIDWARRGTMRQFYLEVQAQLADEKHVAAEMEDDTLVFYRITKQGGFLGIGGKTVREPLLEVSKRANEIVVSKEPRDEAFLLTLAERLEPH